MAFGSLGFRALGSRGEGPVFSKAEQGSGTLRLVVTA